jgi:hypothetical protein
MSEPFDSEPINPDFEELGLYYDRAKQCVVWQEMLSYDPESPWCKNIEAKIETDDRAFLKACGIRPDDR